MHFPLTSTIVRPEHCDPLFLLRELGLKRDYCALLESARRQGSNDYSFLALGARDVMIVQNGEVCGSRYVPDGKVPDPLAVFRETVDFGEQGERLRMGYIGFLSYEAARYFEDIELTPDPEIPDAMFVLPEILLKIDHAQHEVTIIMHKDSQEDTSHIEKMIHASPFRDDSPKEEETDEPLPLPRMQDMEALRQTKREDFCASIKSIQESILAGEAFQVVLSQELLQKNGIPPDHVYEQLRALNPSPYMYYYQTPGMTLVGASPETLVRVDGRQILYRPIAGTRKRTGNEAEDRKMRDELAHDEKERCEHQMLVDLGRNDVGRVAEIGSVEVQNPFHVETYAHVYHIVSDIVARIRPDLIALDVVRSVFPAGTLTGAPKVRAMEIIRDTEKSPRGIYGGAFGYIDLSGNVDFAIMIRTMLFRNGKISLRVGAGIVKDSVPEHEDNECLHKARSCIAAVQLARQSLSLP
ncbi:MAG: anthranilate synthase component I [Candidatus Peregrinibacteria bacterium Greene0416_19]|nr:MAG: anthranilate synthase component I [Candidatus Peregrinibacteria bacterium Greene0416_19]